MTFKELNLIEPILKALDTEGYETPTPIQAEAIPLILQGRDLLGCAQTGTGKTAAFTIPMLQLLYNSRVNGQQASGRRPITSLILTPTRELAIQIDESIAAYGRHCNIRHAVVFGGVGQNPQVKKLQSGIDLLTATPGRLLDLMNQGFVDLRDLKFFVLDEADRMLDMGFIHDVRRVIAKLPAKRQSLFFSATMPNEIVKLSASILTNPSKVEVTPQSTTVEKIDQSVYFVDKDNKNDLLKDILQDRAIRSALVFTRTKHGANKVVKELLRHEISAAAIHGNKSQTARQKALGDFKEGSLRVLVATDIASRGIDVDNLSHVINFELPNIPESYVHRIGRTGRAGAEGVAISFCNMEEKAFLKDIEKLIGMKVPVQQSDYQFKGTPPEPKQQRGGGGGGGRRNSSPGGSRGGSNPRNAQSNSPKPSGQGASRGLSRSTSSTSRSSGSGSGGNTGGKSWGSSSRWDD